MRSSITKTMSLLALLLALPTVAIAGATEPAAAASTAKAASTTAAHATSVDADGTGHPLIPLSTFARHPSVMSPRLSPDGKHLAVRMDDADGRHHALVIYKLADMSITSILKMRPYRLPLNMVWVSPTWLVVATGKQIGSLDAPLSTGEVIATNLKGSKQRYLYGYHNYGKRHATRQPDRGYGYIVGTPDVSNGHVYVRSELWNEDGRSALYNIDASNESRDLIAEIDVGNMSFVIGPQGKPTYAYGANDQFEFVAYRHMGDDWHKLDPKVVGARFQPFGYTRDKQQVYAWWSKDGGPYELVEAPADGSKRQVLAWNPFANIGGVQWTAEPNEQPFAAITETGRPKPIFIHPNLPDAKIYRALQKNFPDEFINFINYSDDGAMLLFYVSSDRDPGSYYLINTKTFKVRKLFAARPWVDPQQMAHRVPIRFKASDGVKLDGFLTMPPGRGKTNLPMVLVPHGGPHGIRDTWFFDNDAQMLASRGYLVLQVNYRGSGGRGVDFVQSGYRKWGTRIQRDLIDGVKWAIKQGYADPDRICVYGASFGGYSALMSVIRAPKLFQCAVGYAGVYDLKMILDNQDSDFGQNYFKTVLGTDEAKLAANSPDKLAEKITVPVFLAHGKDDKRAPFEHAEAMRDALKAADKPFEWMAVDKEGHGFYTKEHRMEFMQRMLAFLDKYIGRRGQGTEDRGPSSNQTTEQ